MGEGDVRTDGDVATRPCADTESGPVAMWAGERLASESQVSGEDRVLRAGCGPRATAARMPRGDFRVEATNDVSTHDAAPS
jgi:hypothetical protein